MTTKGIMAPPTIDEIRMEAPSSAKCPNPFIPKVKMVGKRMELKNPTATMEITEILP